MLLISSQGPGMKTVFGPAGPFPEKISKKSKIDFVENEIRLPLHPQSKTGQ